MRRFLPPLLAAALLAGSGPVVPQEPAPATAGPWELLARVRGGLEEAAPLAADFTQTYLPAGFTSGDAETGRLVLALPSCLRWDYEAPFPKSYLLCGRTAWAWNPGETTGRRYEVPPEERLGLDLLRLSVAELRQAYAASLGDGDGRRVEIVLEPLAGAGAAPRITRATLRVDTAERRPLEIGYVDVEGNRTRFVLERYRPIGEQGLLEPRRDIEWLEG